MEWAITFDNTTALRGVVDAVSAVTQKVIFKDKVCNLPYSCTHMYYIVVRFLLGTVQTHHCYIIFIATCALTDIAQLLFISSVRKLQAPPHDGRRARCAL